MLDFKLLLEHPELASAVKFEITAKDLVSVAAAVAKSLKEQERLNNPHAEAYLTQEEVCEITHRDRTTISRWVSKGLLTRNQLGLYKRSDVDKILTK